MKLMLLVVTLLALCHHAIGGQVKIRCDDDIRVTVDEVVIKNEHEISGWQWRDIVTANYGDSAKLLTLWMYNQGGPGYGRGEIDGKDLFTAGLKCRTFGGGNPDTQFRGWNTNVNYVEDANWKDPVAVWSHGTAGIIPNAQGFWANPTSAKHCICRLKLNVVKHELKWRVDDESQMMVDCNERGNTFNQGGSQWRTVYSTIFDETNKVLAFRMNNGPGPGEALVTIDGKDASGAGWKCMEFGHNENPDTKFRNWCGKDFNDNGWHGDWLTRGKSATPGMSSHARWFWGSKQEHKNCICRLRLDQLKDTHELKIRMDDEVRLTVDCDERINTYRAPGSQWNVVYSAFIPNDAKWLTVQGQNGGGPGHWILTIDDKDMSGMDWRCKEFPVNKDPDVLFPNNCKPDFDDSDWSGASSTNQKGATPGMLTTARWIWGAVMKPNIQVICRVPLNQPYKELKMRVDDEVRILVDGRERGNAWRIPGWQWRWVWPAAIRENEEILAIQIFDQGGAYYVCNTLDGVIIPAEGWKCMDYPNGKNPDILMDGWYTKDYDDSSWYTPEITNKKVNTPGLGHIDCWWPKQSARSAVCRHRLRTNTHKLTIRCDDEVEVAIDGNVKLNTFNTAGSNWKDVNDIMFSDQSQLLALNVYNSGGPGECYAAIDGHDLSGHHFRCARYNKGQNPDQVYKGWKNEEFADEQWRNIVLTNGKGGKHKWFWPGPQSWSNAVCRLHLKPREYTLQARCDDEVQCFADGNELFNTFDVPGSQWMTVKQAKVSDDTKVLACRMRNGPGPGECLTTLDGHDLSGAGWKCTGIPASKKFDDVAWVEPNFDDSKWGTSLTSRGKPVTPGMNPSAVWWWGGEQAQKDTICRLRLDVKKKEMKIRVDDEVIMKADGQERYNSFKRPGSQHNLVVSLPIEEDVSLLTLQMQNGAGPGFAVVTIDGVDTSGRWKCKGYNSGDPEALFPGWSDPDVDFGDSDWETPTTPWPTHVVPKMNANAKKFWVSTQALKRVVCRMHVNAKKHVLKVRCDDEVLARADNEVLANAFVEAGWQWTKVYESTFPEHAEILSFRMFNQGGPGECTATIDGRDISTDRWRCTDFTDELAEKSDPAWYLPEFDDSTWRGARLVRSRKPHTNGFPIGTKWFWGGLPSAKHVACRLRLKPQKHEFRVRCDDEVQAFVDGDEIIDSYDIPGSNWRSVFSHYFTDNNRLLALKMTNGPGPGHCITTIDGEDVSGWGWRCRCFAAGRNPDADFSGWSSEYDFNDLDWPGIHSTNQKAPTPGMNSGARWWWGGVQQQKNCVCRLKLDKERATVIMRVDDELQAKVDCNTRVNAYEVPGWQWRDLWKFSVEDGAKVLAVKMYNQGGPGYGVATIGGNNMNEGWVCERFPGTKDPDDVIPNWCAPNFDDHSWTPPTKFGGNTPALMSGKNSDNHHWWCGPQFKGFCVCRYRLSEEGICTIKIRNDDDLDLWVDGHKYINEFDIGGWQYTKVNTVKFPCDSSVIAIHAYNQGGPGYITGTINGQDLAKQNWRCTSINGGPEVDPNDSYSGWNKVSYTGACDWKSHKVHAGTTSGTPGIDPKAQRWWGGETSEKNVICRLSLYDVDLNGNECKNELKPGEVLHQGSKLCSKNGLFIARLQAGDGNFVVYRLVDNQWKARWATHVYGHGLRLAMQQDGNLVIYNPSREAVWAADRTHANPAGLTLKDDGILVLYDKAGKEIWSSRCDNELKKGQVLKTGNRLCSANGEYFLVLQKGDGNLVIYKTVDRKPVWATHKYSKNSPRLVVQHDGNVVIYDADNKVIWATNKQNKESPVRLVLRNDGKLLVVDGAEKQMWISH